jgi:myo-inositol-1(or 4)-monophosphatase
VTLPPATPAPEELLAVALQAARSAAALVRDRAGAGVTVAATKSSDIDVVTQADRDSEELIRSTILAARPDDGFLGEEGDAGEGNRVGSSGVRWVVDPIDGTVNFLYGLPEYAVSVAAEIEGETVAGVVVNVPQGIEYAAHADPSAPLGARGVRRTAAGEAPLAVRAPAPLGQRLVATGFAYTEDLRGLQAAALARLLPRVRDIRRNGAAALELCHVAEGTLDGYFEVGVHPWDYGAGALVARAAGARFEVLSGLLGRSLAICAPEHGFEELRGAVLDAGYGA